MKYVFTVDINLQSSWELLPPTVKKNSSNKCVVEYTVVRITGFHLAKLLGMNFQQHVFPNSCKHLPVQSKQ